MTNDLREALERQLSEVRKTRAEVQADPEKSDYSRGWWAGREASAENALQLALASPPQDDGPREALGMIARQDSDIVEPSSTDLAAVSEHVEQYISELESIISSNQSLAAKALALLPDGAGWRPLTKKAVDKLHIDGNPFFASITVHNRATGYRWVEVHCLELRERDNDDGTIYLEAGLYGMDGDESGWSLWDYEHFVPFDLPERPEPTPPEASGEG